MCSARFMAQQITTSNEKLLTLTTSETIFIHTNATTFISGEMLYYKLYCLNQTKNTPSEISKIAYVELLKQDKTSVFKHKLFLEKGMGQGDFFVQPNLQTGSYKLIGYSHWALNKSEDALFEITIFIINPYQVKAQTLESNLTKTNENKLESENTKPVESKIVLLELNKKKFTNRDLVQLKIKPLSDSLQGGNYSLSVRRKEGLPSKSQLTSEKFIERTSKTTNTITKKSDNLHLPELRGELISGKIISKNESNSVEFKKIALSITGKTFALKIINTDATGNFKFTIDKPYYNSDVSIQVVNEKPEDFTIVLDKSNPISYALLSEEPEFNLSPDLKQTIEERSVASQIENAYLTKKLDSISPIKNKTSFYEPLSKDYILDDYSRFQTMEETITEVVKEMYFTKKNKKYSIGVRDNDPLRKLSEPALVLVDGLLIQNVDELFDYDTQNIYKISIVTGGYFYGSNVYNGIINIITKNYDFVSKASSSYILKPELIRPLKNKIYFNPDYSDASKMSRIPDYRYQLLWNPSLKITKSENTFSFYTSDISGIFEIYLEGFTATGKPVSIKESIEVK